MHRITIAAMSFSLVAGSVRVWNLDFAKIFQDIKKPPIGRLFLFQLFVVLMSVVVAFPLDIHFFIKSGLKICSGLVGQT